MALASLSHFRSLVLSRSLSCIVASIPHWAFKGF
uniref:Uncharacterized protein n=1 Tax=Rhizophora mucronata TaxID=61149 RepID=A0A2P2PX16_RHIMU